MHSLCGACIRRQQYQSRPLPPAPRAAALEQLEERERELGIEPDAALAAYVAALNKAGKQNIVTDLVLKTLGLEVCAETLVVRGRAGPLSAGAGRCQVPPVCTQPRLCVAARLLNRAACPA